MVLATRIQEFENAIRDVLSRFEAMFGTHNPIPLWRQGRIARTGFLSQGQQDEYSFHGSGCTVEIDGRTVSFDFDEDGQYCYTAFKFGLFLDDDSVNDSLIADLFVQMVDRGELVHVPGNGVRLVHSSS